MKMRILACLLSLVLCVTALSAPLSVHAAYSLDEETTVCARSALVMFLGDQPAKDAVLFEQNADERIAPAGLVRVMVGLHAMKLMEQKKLDPATATASFTKEIDELTRSTLGGTGLLSIGLKVGDVWHLDDVLKASMMSSAGDAVTLLSVALAGSPENFVSGMNALAGELGCKDTHFQNAYGLEHDEQYTTARDMYRILRYASFHYASLTYTLGLSDHTVTPVVGESLFFPTTCEPLRYYSDHYIKEVRFGRSGFTEATGQSCASVARIDGLDIMTVVMGCRDDVGDNFAAFRDSKTLFKWVKNNFAYKTVISKNQPLDRLNIDLAWNTDTVPLVAGKDLVVMLRKETDINSLRYEIVVNQTYLNEDGNVTAPIDTTTAYATAKVYDGNVHIGTIPLYAQTAVDKSAVLSVTDSVWRVLSSPFVLIALAVLVLLFVVYIVVSVAHNRSRRKKNQKRIKRYK